MALRPTTTDPMNEMIADGRIHIRTERRYGHPEVRTVDLDAVHTAVSKHLLQICEFHANIRKIYPDLGVFHSSYFVEIFTMSTYICGHLYNKLRSILQLYSPSIVSIRMKDRCPVPADIEFPAWISSTLGSIGPLRVNDGPTDRLIIYATNNYGRMKMPELNQKHGCGSFISLLRNHGVPLSQFNQTNMMGSFFPTIRATVQDGLFNFYGTLHHSHYENEDVRRIALLLADDGSTPFEDVGMTVGFINDPTAVAAVKNASFPDKSADAAAAATTRACHLTWHVNEYGIQPVADGISPAQDEGFYVIGRGKTPYYRCSLGSGIIKSELLKSLYFRCFYNNSPFGPFGPFAPSAAAFTIRPA